MKIGFDIDDTLVNTKQAQIIKWKEYITTHHNPEFTDKLPSIINEFNNSFINNFWDYYRQELSFETTFKNYASFITNQLHQEGHQIYIITSRPDEKYQNLKVDLIKWFSQNNIYTDAIYTNIREKGTFCRQNNIDILVDDTIKHCNDAKENGIYAILFNHNPNYEGYQTENLLTAYYIIQEINKQLNHSPKTKKL